MNNYANRTFYENLYSVAYYINTLLEALAIDGILTSGTTSCIGQQHVVLSNTELST